MNHTRKTAPTAPPIDLALAKQQCRLGDDVTDENDLIASYITAAVEWVEEWTGRSLMTQTHQVSLCGFPSRLWLPRAAPLASVTFVKYYDASNVLTTLSATVYTVAAFSEPAVLALASGQVWPTTYDRVDAVQVEYITGTSDPDAVPAGLRHAIQMLVGHWYANRESVVIGTIAQQVPMTVEMLCAPHRLYQRNEEWVA